MHNLDRLEANWQILDVGSIWMKEFAASLSKYASTISWIPSISNFGHWAENDSVEQLLEPEIQLRRFPLQRGYARYPLNRLLPYEQKLLPRLRRVASDRFESHLICTTPFYAPVAELWDGPVVYYVTDLTKKYEGAREDEIIALDKRLCSVSKLVCPNSKRIAKYLVKEAGCDTDKIVLVPNATRRTNIAERPLYSSAALPLPIAQVKRPIAGVIGNLAGNMDWCLLKDSIARTSYVSWVFVGPTSMAIPDKTQAAARHWVMDNAYFTGQQPYGDLQHYARSFDVAILPYRKREPTYSGSSTRFYEHLAACRPMIGTRGFAELLEKQPLITLVDTAEELAAALLHLQQDGFQDGQEEHRWSASQSATWDDRALAILSACDGGAACGQHPALFAPKQGL